MLRIIRTARAFLTTVSATWTLGRASMRAREEDATGWASARIARAWGERIVRACGGKIEAAGIERLDPNEVYIFAGNHQSYLDIPALLSVMPLRMGFLAKSSLFKIPVFNQAMFATGSVPLHRHEPRRAVRELKEAARRLDAGQSIFIFPEGTRSRTGRLQPFLSGSLKLARDSGRPLVPVAITGTFDLLPPGRWVLSRPRTAKIVIGEPIDPHGHRKADLAKETRRRIEELLEGIQPSK